MRVVIDTNVFVSSFFGGKPREIIDLWHNGTIILCLSKAILDEYIHVLQRMGLENEKELGALLSLFATGYNILFTKKTPALSVVESDPHDDKFIECALALQSDMIITGDKALRSVNRYRKIRIVTPDEFLREYVE